MYDIRVSITFRDGRHHVGPVTVLPPGGRWLGMPDEQVHPEAFYDEEYASVAITFRDTRGRLWHRDQLGVLRGPDGDVVQPETTGEWDRTFDDEWDGSVD